jgi:hypothetical protein
MIIGFYLFVCLVFSVKYLSSSSGLTAILVIFLMFYYVYITSARFRIKGMSDL